MRDHRWAGWSPDLPIVLRSMTPFDLSPELDLYAGDTQIECKSGYEKLFSCSHCDPRLISIMRVVDVYPDLGGRPTSVIDKHQSLMYDIPLPVIIRRYRLQTADGTSHAQRVRSWAIEKDVVSAVPEAIFLSAKTCVTMAFAEWVDRRRRLRFNATALRRDVASMFWTRSSLLSDPGGKDWGPSA